MNATFFAQTTIPFKFFSASQYILTVQDYPPDHYKNNSYEHISEL